MASGSKKGQGRKGGSGGPPRLFRIYVLELHPEVWEEASDARRSGAPTARYAATRHPSIVFPHSIAGDSSHPIVGTHSGSLQASLSTY